MGVCRVFVIEGSIGLGDSSVCNDSPHLPQKNVSAGFSKSHFGHFTFIVPFYMSIKYYQLKAVVKSLDLLGEDLSIQKE
jgi:hypothetical protein